MRSFRTQLCCATGLESSLLHRTLTPSYTAGNLPTQVGERDIEYEFRSFGRIINVWVARKPPGFGAHPLAGPRASRGAAPKDVQSLDPSTIYLWSYSSCATAGLPTLPCRKETTSVQLGVHRPSRRATPSITAATVPSRHNSSFSCFLRHLQRHPPASSPPDRRAFAAPPPALPVPALPSARPVCVVKFPGMCARAGRASSPPRCVGNGPQTMPTRVGYSGLCNAYCPLLNEPQTSNLFCVSFAWACGAAWQQQLSPFCQCSSPLPPPSLTPACLQRTSRSSGCRMLRMRAARWMAPTTG